MSNNSSQLDMDEKTHAQVMQKIFTQMSFKKGIDKHGDRAIEGMQKELRQMHSRDSFIPKHKKDLTDQQWKNKYNKKHQQIKLTKTLKLIALITSSSP